MDEATQAQLAELNESLAELAEAASTAELGSILAEMLEVMKDRKPQEQTVPVVNVSNDVHPAPVTVQMMPGPSRVLDYVDHKYDDRGRLIRSVPVFKGD